MPEELLDERITCKNCKAVFTPRATLTRKTRAAPQKGISPLIVIGAFVGLMGLILIIANPFKAKPKPKEEPVAEKRDYMGINHPAYKAVERLCTAVHGKDTAGLDLYLDGETWYDLARARLGDEAVLKVLDGEAKAMVDTFKAKKWNELTPDQRNTFFELQMQLFNGLPEHKMLVDYKPTEVVVPRPDVTDSPNALDFRVSMARLDGDFWGEGEMLVKAKEVRPGAWRLFSIENTKVPRDPARPKDPTKGFHKGLGKGTVEEVKTATGEVVKVRRIKPQPLDHLETTPEPLRKEIDALLTKMKQPDLPGGELNTARFRLEKIGMPAVPRILTQFYETRIEGVAGDQLQNNLIYLGVLTRMLRSITMFDGYGFSPRRQEDGTLGATDEERQRALEGWFGWYSEYGWKLTNEKLDEERAKADEEIGIEDWEDHKKKKRTTKPPSGGNDG
ncbi:MAG: hypothetical protein R3F30_14960 [Planctomycetota bacterium]